MPELDSQDRTYSAVLHTRNREELEMIIDVHIRVCRSVGKDIFVPLDLFIVTKKDTLAMMIQYCSQSLTGTYTVSSGNQWILPADILQNLSTPCEEGGKIGSINL
jgi:hypothetical protein